MSRLSPAKQGEVLSAVETYTAGKTKEKPQMLPVNRAELLAKKVVLVALKGEQGVFSGIVVASDETKHKDKPMSEVGTLWVPEKDRGEGIGHGLVSEVTTLLAGVGINPYAFCNPKSFKVFRDNGYKTASQEQIPREAFDLCSSCPHCPAAGGCCDTQLIYSKGDGDD